MSVELSIVVPIYCEEQNLDELYARLTNSMKDTGREFELIFVNDHSKDGSLRIMRELNARDPRVKIVSFSRNFGHQTAITAGMQFARGESVVLMDGDLQDPPEVIPDLIREKEKGNWDLVYAIRKSRVERPLVRPFAFLFYRLLKKISYIDIPMDSGDFCVMSRRVVDELNKIPERNRYLRGLRSWVGFRQTGLEYERAARKAGEPKYTFRSSFKLALDAFFSFSFLPLRISTILGLALSGAGLAYALYVFINRLRGAYQATGGWSTIVVSVLVMGGVQLVMLGIIGEYLGRIYEEIKRRPQYIVEELIGFDSSASAHPPVQSHEAPQTSSDRL